MTKTTRELQISGTYRSDRHGERVEAEKPSGVPIAPGHLTTAEKKIFNEVAALMYKNDSIASLDSYALETFSVQLCLFRKAKKELQKSGEYLVSQTNKNGSTNQVASPWLKVLKDSNDVVLKLSAKLGLTPMDRNKVSKVVDSEPGSPLLKDGHSLFH
jgi:P27 family predicted phage terminase small subunit